MLQRALVMFVSFIGCNAILIRTPLVLTCSFLLQLVVVYNVTFGRWHPFKQNRTQRLNPKLDRKSDFVFQGSLPGLGFSIGSSQLYKWQQWQRPSAGHLCSLDHHYHVQHSIHTSSSVHYTACPFFSYCACTTTQCMYTMSSPVYTQPTMDTI